jgi:predicted transcriptional regulator YdeE
MARFITWFSPYRALPRLEGVGRAFHLVHDAGVTGPALNARFEERKHEIANRVNSSLQYAVSIDPPNYNDDADEFELMIGVEVDSLEHIPDGMESMELLSSTYASVVKADDSTFGSLIRWINESDYELADSYSIEVHDLNKDSVLLMFPILKQ